MKITRGEQNLNDRKDNRRWKGFAALILLLAFVSVVAYLLSSLEGFAAGVVVVFIGWLVSFFREDIKRALGLTADKQETQPVVVEEESHLWKLDKRIAKDRKKTQKIISKYQSEYKPSKRRKIAREIVEQTTGLLATIDQAKARAIQTDHRELLDHYESIAQEMHKTRNEYQRLATSEGEDTINAQN